MKKIAVVGYKGRMGSLISSLLEKEFLVCGVDKENKLEDFNDVDLVIDFASHESSVTSAKFCLEKNIPLIIGSTGQTEEENKQINEISKSIKVVRKANFSKGFDVLKNFIDNVILLKPERFEIFEKHHINKKDKPSGTALELKKYIEQSFCGVVEICSVREGDEMGEHTIVAFCGDEKLSATHNVYSRNAFAQGVVLEAKSLIN